MSNFYGATPKKFFFNLHDLPRKKLHTFLGKKITRLTIFLYTSYSFHWCIACRLPAGAQVRILPRATFFLVWGCCTAEQLCSLMFLRQNQQGDGRIVGWTVVCWHHPEWGVHCGWFLAGAQA